MAALTTVNIGKSGLYVTLQAGAAAFEEELATSEGLFGADAIKEFWASPEGGNGMGKCGWFKFCPTPFSAEDYIEVVGGNFKSSRIVKLWWAKKGFRSLYWKVVDELGESPADVSFEDDKTYKYHLLGYSKGSAERVSRAESSGVLKIEERPKFANKDHCFFCPKGKKFKSQAFGQIILGRHHCKACGKSVCHDHGSRMRKLPEFEYTEPERVCSVCFEKYGGEDDNAVPLSEKVEVEKSSSMFGSFKTLATTAAISAKKHAVRAANEVVNLSSESKPTYRFDIMNLELVAISQMENVSHGLDLLFNEGDSKMVYTFEFRKKVDKLAWGAEFIRLAKKYQADGWGKVHEKLVARKKSSENKLVGLVRASSISETLDKAVEKSLSKLFDIGMNFIGDPHGWLRVVAEGDLDAIEAKAAELIGTKEPNLAGVVDMQGCNALHYACWLYKPVKIIRYLVEELGCNPNTPMTTSLTAVHFSAWKGHLPALKYLVECKSSPGDLFKTTLITKSTPKSLICYPYVVRKPFGGCDNYTTPEIVAYLDEMEKNSMLASKNKQTLAQYLAARMPEEKEGFFLSHFQMNAGPQVMDIRDMIERFASKESKIKVWLDKDEECTEEGMKQGVRELKYFLLFLTDGYFTRPFCRLEICEAIKRNKTMILVNDMDCSNADGDYVWDGDWPRKRSEAARENLPPLTKGMDSFGGYINQCKNADWSSLANSEEYRDIFFTDGSVAIIAETDQMGQFLLQGKFQKYTEGLRGEGYEELEDLKELAHDEKTLVDLFEKLSFKPPEQSRFRRYLKQLEDGKYVTQQGEPKPMDSAEFAQHVCAYVFNKHKSIPFYSCSGDFADFGRASIKSIFEAGKYDGCGGRCYLSDNFEDKDFSKLQVFIIGEGGYCTTVKNNLEVQCPSLAGRVITSSDAGGDALKHVHSASHCIIYLRCGTLSNEIVKSLVLAALDENKKLTLVHDTDVRQGGSAPGDVAIYREESGVFSNRLFTTPEGRRKVIPYCTEGEFRRISIQLILKSLEA
jgi:hypothetical protein